MFKYKLSHNINNIIMTNTATAINKKLRFNTTIYIYEIASLRQSKEHLWWSDDDFDGFKKSCWKEVKDILKRHQSMTVAQARKMLYQPGNMTIVYDEQNFV